MIINFAQLARVVGGRIAEGLDPFLSSSQSWRRRRGGKWTLIFHRSLNAHGWFRGNVQPNAGERVEGVEEYPDKE